MGIPATVFLNDYDLAGLGVAVEVIDGLRAAPAQRWVSTPVTGRMGELLLSGRPTVQSRGLTLHGKVLADTQLALEAAVDGFKSRLLQGAIELRTVAQPGRVLLCRLTGFTEQPWTPQMLSPQFGFAADLEAVSPAWYDRDPFLLTGAATVRVACPVGDLPVAPLVQILGAVTNPVLTLRAANGDTRSSMAFTVTLAATDYLEIDMDAKTVTRYASGTATNGLSLLTSGDFLALSPEDGDELVGASPALDVSGGSLVVAYARRWA
jgi:hypothetical protein